jgi:hypothetical protein
MNAGASTRRSRGWVRSLSLLVPVLVSGCASYYYVRPGTLEPNRAQVSQDQRSAVWHRAVGALLDQGYVPQVLNEAASFISAKRREDLADDALAGTFAVVWISPEGSLRVEVTGAGFFHSEQQLINAVGERQRALLNEILNPSGAGNPR